MKENYAGSELSDIKSKIVDNTGIGVICFDENEKCIYANMMMQTWFKSDNQKKKIKKILSEKIQKLDNNTKFDIKSDERYFRIEYGQIHREDESIQAHCFSIVDKTDEIREFRKKRHEMTHDELTGLCNYKHFIEKSEKIIKDGMPGYIICSDISDFKLVNELFGREKGDMVLKKQAELMERYADENTVYGRIADDHFVMLVPKKSFNEQYFTECIDEIKKTVDSSVYKMQIYFGVYEVKDATESVSSMCDKTKLAISSIKGDYQKTVAYYDAELLKKVLHEKNVVAEYEHAEKNDEFKMYLQPQIAVGEKVLGGEALVRWINKEGKLVPPIEFIPVFEKTGLIYRMDMCIWEQAAKKLAEWKKKGRTDLHISVNISPRDFYYVDIYDTFVRLVEKYDINPENLNLEITETAITSDIPDLMQIIEKLQDKGFLIEIDDFGNGYSSLNMLKDIRADVLKIDMGFLRETENKERSRIILNKIISMAKELNMPVITEGVESYEQVRFLTDMGCNIFQGYYFSKPITVEEFEEKYF